MLATAAIGLSVFSHDLLDAAIIACMIPFSVAGTIRGLVRLKREKSE